MKRTLPFGLMLLGISMLGMVVLSPAPAVSADPYKLKYQDRDWITITGEVNSTREENFTLDFGDGLITVEMDDWDFYNEASRLVPGEKVTVYGRIDNGFYEAKTIEADMVYAHNRHTYFYANDVDEEGDYAYYSYHVSYPIEVPSGTWMSVSGKVTDIDGRELTLHTGTTQLTVNTEELGYNPLDDVGYQQIDEGDRIYASGLVDINVFDKSELNATIMTSLTKDKTKNVKQDSES